MPDTQTDQTGGEPQDEAAEETILYMLPELVGRLGEATPQEVSEYTEGLTKADLLAEGSEVATGRIDKDTARLYGKAADFFDMATEEQLDALVGVSPDMLRVAVWAAHQGSQRAEAREKAMTTGDISKDKRVGEAATLRAKAMSRRRVLRVALTALAAGDRATLDAIETAHGVVTTPKSLGESLEALVKIGRGMLQAPSPALAKRLKNSRLTTKLLDDTVALAKAARSTGEAAAAVAGGMPVPQSEVDYWDGINLYFLGTFIDVFEAANAVDPTVPRLGPVSLWRYFNPRRRSDAPAAAPAPVAPSAQPPQG